jgi:hypothetical protein
MAAKRYIYKGHTTASIKIKNESGDHERVNFTDGGFIGGGDAGASKFVPAQVTVFEEWKQKAIEGTGAFKSGLIVCIKDEKKLVSPLKELEEDANAKDVLSFPDVSTVQEAANQIMAMFPEVKASQVNGKAKVKALAEEKNIDFPNISW